MKPDTLVSVVEQCQSPKEYPTLTTFFEGEIISKKHPFLTRKWDADEDVDRKHWGKFQAFYQYAKTFNSDDFDYEDLKNGDYVFMRWKEQFLVPDHTIKDISGASFAGFYYISFQKSAASIEGYYYHRSSECRCGLPEQLAPLYLYYREISVAHEKGIEEPPCKGLFPEPNCWPWLCCTAVALVHRASSKGQTTEYHLGLLKAKLAKYRAQLLEPSKSAAAKGEGFDVMKSGDARVALIGFPSVGKSTFLSLMTSTASEAASYEFTTLTCIPGVIEYKGANIQLLDLPGIIEGAAQGKGRGRQVIAVARTADVVIMMLDATKGEVQRSLLEKELESVGIRLNKCKPNIYFKPKKGGGISFNSTVTLTQCSEKLVQLILHEYKIFNAEVLFREDCSPDEFIDVIVGNRVYMPCLYVYNKIDQISMEEVDRLARRPNSVVISCGMKLNLDYLLEKLWEYLALTCIFTKKRGQRPDFSDAIILRKGASVEHVCHRIHRTLASQFKYALVWGTSTKYSPQRVGLTHLMEHEDVIQIVKK
ncbi:Developmentally-regulated GTP-binding protein 2 [Chelonia mydas]|uniref:Developmentally-regulated GTP-binding protein 2 n=2 Tax=Chelonia mydas TaxID=8469 RepID=M7BYA2_CHEMY|nr:Developmentally-regulated GTP-binding protein 2 [Chelonia mydas]